MTSTDGSGHGCSTSFPDDPGRPTPAECSREAFRKRVQVAALDPFHGYKNAIDDQLADAISVLDAFHVVRLGGQAVDEVRRRVQQATTGRRGRKTTRSTASGSCCAAARSGSPTAADPIARLDADDRTPRCSWLGSAPNSCGRSTTTSSAAGRRLATKIIDSFPSCPIPEIARLGRTLKRWRTAFLAYFDTSRVSNAELRLPEHHLHRSGTEGNVTANLAAHRAAKRRSIIRLLL